MKRLVYLDAIRIIACSLVIVYHMPIFYAYTYNGGFVGCILSSINVLARIAVPLFFMVSGALLLGKEEDLKTLFQKRIKRTLLLILIFQLVLQIIKKICSIIEGTTFELSIEKLIRGFFSNDLDGCGFMWFLYAYLGFLVVLPLLRRAVKNMVVEEFYTLLVLNFVLNSFIPVLNIIFAKLGIESIQIVSQFSVPFSQVDSFFYPIMGFYIDNKINIKNISIKKYIIICMLIIITCSIFNGIIPSFTNVLTIVLFIIIKHLFVIRLEEIQNNKTGRIISFFGSLTIGVYVLEPCLKNIVFYQYDRIMSNVDSFSSMITVSFIWLIFSMSVSFFITYFLRKIPFFKNIL